MVADILSQMTTGTAQGEPRNAEQRVVELAAFRMTNRDVSAKLSVSATTVEATLARIYRTLGIRSGQNLPSG